MRPGAFAVVLSISLFPSAWAAQTPETPVVPQDPAVTTTPLAKPAVTPPPGKVAWASPKPETVLFRPGTVMLDWTSTYPEGTQYAVTTSTDGKTFQTVLGQKITDTHLSWVLPEMRTTNLWVRVKALDAAGAPLGLSTLPVHILPADAIVVSKTNQRLWAFEDGRVRQRYAISTGMRQYETRAGWYTVYLREALHHSRLYDVDMPYALFFSGGEAIHASTALRDLGSPASHGCVRLPRRHARVLFNASQVGRPIIVTPWGENMRYLDRVPATPAANTTPRVAAAR